MVRVSDPHRENPGRRRSLLGPDGREGSLPGPGRFMRNTRFSDTCLRNSQTTYLPPTVGNGINGPVRTVGPSDTLPEQRGPVRGEGTPRSLRGDG